MRAWTGSAAGRSRRDLLGAGIGLLGLGGCQLLPDSRPAPREFRLTPKTTFDALPTVGWSLQIGRPEASPTIDTTRIAVVRSGVEIDYYANARWVDRPPAMLQPILVQSFRNSGAIAVVGNDRAGFRPDFVLNTDITAFHALQGEGAAPEVRVEIAGSLIQMPRRNAAGATEIGRTVQATGSDLIAVAAAFDDALGKVVKRLVEWTLATGQQAYAA
jgi:cholesterol transport system auxiliary component